MTDERPDIVVVITDQQRADLCRREGFPLDPTPFLDGLGAAGVWFDRAYTTSPLCCPARTSLLTGRYPTAHRVVQNPGVRAAVFDTDLFGVARSAGYATALIGKNHTYLTDADVDHFVGVGHDGRGGMPADATDESFRDWLAGLRFHTATAPTPFPPEVQNPYRIVDETLRWVDTVPVDRPLLTIVSFPEPHNPYQVPEPYFSMFPPESLPPVTAGAEAVADRPFAWHYLRALGERAFPDYAATLDRARANYLGMLRLLDDQLRRLYDGLAARHAQRQRVFVATADHGDFVGEYGLMRKGAEIPDVLARVPLVVTGDAIEPGGGAAHPAHVSLADLLPTCCAAMGAAVPAGVQGRSLWPLLTGAGYPAGEFASAYVEQGIGGLPYEAGDVDEPMPGLAGDPADGTARFDALNAVTQGGRRRKVRSGDWALDADLTGQFRLYNLAEDPAEQHDRWPEPGVEPVRTALLQLLAVWQLRSEDPLPSPPNGYRRKQDPHGYLAPYATLPAVSQPSRVVPDRSGDPAPDRGDGRA